MRRILILLVILFTGIFGLRAQSVKKDAAPEKKGVASYYDNKFNGRKTATGEVFHNKNYTAACNTLKLGTYVKVTNLTNGNIVYVRVNDRMAPSNKRLIDLAAAAADMLGFKDAGLAKVKLEIVNEEEGENCILAQNEPGTPAPKNQL